MNYIIKAIYFLLFCTLIILFAFPFSSFAAAPSNGSWVPVGSMATRRILSTSTLLQNGKVLVAGGEPSGGGPVIFESLIPFTELYDPISKTFSTTGNLNTPRAMFESPYQIMVTLQNGKALIAGGMQGNFDSIGSSELYDSTSGTWTYTGSLNTSRRDAPSVLLNDGRVLVAGGASGGLSGVGTTLTSSELYDPVSGAWGYTANDLAIPRDGPTMIKLQDGRVLIVGGSYLGSCSSLAEVFNPNTNTWSSAGIMPWGTVAITMTLLSNGKVFANGGEDCGLGTANTAIYDPVANTWISTASIPISPVVNSFLLDDGKVMVRSGNPNGGDPVGLTAPVNEIYNPTTNTWTVTNLPLGGNNGGTYTQLANGDVLKAGGWDCDPSNPACTLASAELFTATAAGDLNVPDYKQFTLPWGSQVYDGADNWFPLAPSITRWGCALTSSAMILNYYGYHLLPDGNPLNPGTLNTWLKDNNGYVDGITSGYVNPQAIAKLSKKAKTINGITALDALQFVFIPGYSPSQLATDLTNSHPDILEEPGHFIIAKGINGSTFDINDPAYNNRHTLNDGYNNTFLSMNRYIPSFTDLSYIMLTINPKYKITITDSSSNPVDVIQYVQQPLNDDLTGFPSGQPVKFLYFKQPPTGDYNVTISGNETGMYSLGSYLYDIGIGENDATLKGTVSDGNPDTFIIHFNADNANLSATNRIITFQSVLIDLQEAEALVLLSHGNANSLYQQLKNAQKDLVKGDISSELKKLQDFDKLLSSQRGKQLSEDAYQILHYDIQSLILGF